MKMIFPTESKLFDHNDHLFEIKVIIIPKFTENYANFYLLLIFLHFSF